MVAGGGSPRNPWHAAPGPGPAPQPRARTLAAIVVRPEARTLAATRRAQGSTLGYRLPPPPGSKPLAPEGGPIAPPSGAYPVSAISHVHLTETRPGRAGKLKLMKNCL